MAPALLAQDIYYSKPMAPTLLAQDINYFKPVANTLLAQDEYNSKPVAPTFLAHDVYILIQWLHYSWEIILIKRIILIYLNFAILLLYLHTTFNKQLFKITILFQLLLEEYCKCYDVEEWCLPYIISNSLLRFVKFLLAAPLVVVCKLLAATMEGDIFVNLGCFRD